MKKISSFIPVHVINKNDLIKELSSYIYEVFPKDILDMIEVSTVKDNVLIISCKNSSIYMSCFHILSFLCCHYSCLGVIVNATYGLRDGSTQRG